MDPLSLALLAGGIGALTSVISAAASYVARRRQRHSFILTIGDKKFAISDAGEAELKTAVDQLQRVLREKAPGDKKPEPA